MTNPKDVSHLTQPQRDQITQVERLLIAPCCYTQTIEVHSSDIARTMRDQVTDMVRRGLPNVAIFNHYKALYGEQILAIPDGTLGTLAFAIPVTVSTVAAGALTYFLYRFHRRKSALVGGQSTVPSAIHDWEAITPERSEAIRVSIRAATEGW